MKDEEKEEEEEEKKKEKVPSIGPSIRAGGGIRTSIRTIAGRRSSAGRWASIPAKPRACSTCKPITYSTAKWAAKRPASKPWPATSSESTPSTRISVPSPIKDRALLAILSSASNPTHWFFIFFYWKISTVTVSAITSISWSNASKCTRSRPSTIRPIDFQAITASRNSSKSFPVSVCVWVHPQLSLAVIQLPVDSIERVADNEACQCRLFSFTSLVLVFLLFFFSLSVLTVSISCFYSTEEDYNSFCLAYMFTYRDFEGGTLGLAWTGDLKNAGGVCEKNGVLYLINSHR